MFKCEFVFLLAIARTVTCDMEGRIVDGDFAKIKDFPYSVFLAAVCSAKWVCGASILNQRLLLTAAHCVFKCKLKRSHTMNVLMGHEDVRETTIARTIKDAIVHEDYDDDIVRHDIAVAVVDRGIPFGDTVKRIIIPRQWPANGRKGIVAGWGITDEITFNFEPRLKYTSQQIRSLNTCEPLGPLWDSVFCAGSTKKQSPHAASGDSGAAFVYDNLQQLGLVSFRVKSRPALMAYTNVTHYYKWIKRVSSEVYCRSFRTISN